MQRLQARLVTVSCTRPGRFILGKRKIRIGSDITNDIVLSEPEVSRRHAVVRRRFGRYFVVELKSTNGTFINNRRVIGRARIRSGNELRLGATRLRFELPAKRLDIRTVLMLAACFVAGIVIVAGYRGKLAISQNGVAQQHPPSSQQRTAAIVNVVKASSARPLSGPTPTSIAPPASQGAALAIRRINYWRAEEFLKQVEENPKWSRGAYLHARYVVETHQPVAMTAHNEDPASPWYTPAGFMAGMNGDIAFCRGSCTTTFSAEQNIDGWMVDAFHRFLILNPNLRQAGFAVYRDRRSVRAVAVLEVGEKSAGGKNLYSPVITFPQSGSQIPLAMAQYDGSETPDPIAGCPGYTAPSGLPITLELGPGWAHRLKISQASVSHDGKTMESCFFTDDSYVSSNAVDQGAARNALSLFGATVVVPRKPLEMGSYSVTVTNAGRTYNWSFLVN